MTVIHAKPRHIAANTVTGISGLTMVGLLLGLLVGVLMGYTIASAKYNSPSYLSIKSSDYRFALDASGIAASNGQCVRLITLEGDEPNAPIYWIRSCNPDSD